MCKNEGCKKCKHFIYQINKKGKICYYCSNDYICKKYYLDKYRFDPLTGEKRNVPSKWLYIYNGNLECEHFELDILYKNLKILEDYTFKNFIKYLLKDIYKSINTNLKKLFKKNRGENE